MKAVEKITPIQGKGFSRFPLCDELIEGDSITPEDLVVDSELVARCDNDILADDATQMVQPLPQGASSFLLTELRPEEGEQGITADRPTGRLEREVRE